MSLAGGFQFALQIQQMQSQQQEAELRRQLLEQELSLAPQRAALLEAQVQNQQLSAEMGRLQQTQLKGILAETTDEREQTQLIQETVGREGLVDREGLRESLSAQGVDEEVLDRTSGRYAMELEQGLQQARLQTEQMEIQNQMMEQQLQVVQQGLAQAQQQAQNLAQDRAREQAVFDIEWAMGLSPAVMSEVRDLLPGASQLQDDMLAAGIELPLTEPDDPTKILPALERLTRFLLGSEDPDQQARGLGYLNLIEQTVGTEAFRQGILDPDRVPSHQELLEDIFSGPQRPSEGGGWWDPQRIHGPTQGTRPDWGWADVTTPGLMARWLGLRSTTPPSAPSPLEEDSLPMLLFGAERR